MLTASDMKVLRTWLFLPGLASFVSLLEKPSSELRNGDAWKVPDSGVVASFSLLSRP